jgi:general stress protein YciG
MANNNNSDDNTMSTGEAGRKGGQRTSETHDREFYEQNGQKGGQRVSDLVEKGKQSEADNA